tara:strand:- start:1258 stop:2667 length:1410 start_codon:yes stop_codon:yes gene_type:complete
MKKILLLLPFFLWTCGGGGGTSSPTEPETSNPPSVENFSLELNENSSVTFSFLGSDPNNNTLTYAINSPPLNGSVTINNGNGTYVPNINFSGSDIFSYTASSKGGVSNIGTVSIIINPVDNRRIFGISSISEDNPTEVILSNDGGFIINGYSSMHPTDGSEYDVLYVIKTDSQGNQLWSKILGDSNNQNRAMSITTGHDGGYLIAGANRDANGSNKKGFILKIDEYGNTEWFKTYDSPIEPTIIRKTMDGSYIVGSSTIKVMKIDTSGNEIWNVNLKENFPNPSRNYYLRSLIETSDGGIAIVSDGHPVSGSNGEDAFLTKIDNNGSFLWIKSFGLNQRYNGFGDIVETSNNDLIIVGQYNGWTRGGFWLLKTDPDGELIWTNNSAENDPAYQVELSNDNGYVISVDNDLIKTNSDGNFEWKVYDISEGMIISLKQTTDGGYIISAGITINQYPDIQLIKIDSEGNQEF